MFPSSVFVPLVVVIILFDSGVPVVSWRLLLMVSWLSICESSVAYCVLHPLVFIGVVKLLFVLGCWPLCEAALPFYSTLKRTISVVGGAPSPVCSLSLQ